MVSPKTPGQRPFKTSRIELQGTEADQSSFLLDAEAQQEWERINSRAARSLRPRPGSWCKSLGTSTPA